MNDSSVSPSLLGGVEIFDQARARVHKRFLTTGNVERQREPGFAHECIEEKFS
jgi:hypothetical protein